MHFHYVLSMGAVYAQIGGFYYWIGKQTGYQYNEVWASIHFWVFTIAINIVFFPMHFQGLAGNIKYTNVSKDHTIFRFISFLYSCFALAFFFCLCLLLILLLNFGFDFGFFIDTLDSSYIIYQINPISIKFRNFRNFPYGPHIKPIWLISNPIRIYFNLNYNKNYIGLENKKRSIIYQWINLITGEIYVGSTSSGSSRLFSYWTPSVIRKNYPIYKNINYYGIHNFAQGILEDLGEKGKISKNLILDREQFFLDILFNNFKQQTLNLSKTAGSNLGSKHELRFKLSRTGSLNPMFNKSKSKEFINMQNKDKKGKNNPQ